MTVPRAILALLALSLAAAGQTTRLYPVDETSRDPAFRAFTRKLRSAVEARSATALRRLVDDEVVVGRGDKDTGWAKFAEFWRPEAEDSRVWPALSDLLSLGFVREQPYLFVSPYLVWRFPRELNMAVHLVVVRDKAALRSEPSVKAPLVSSLSFDIVQRLGRAESSADLGDWYHVRTLDGRTGYLNTRDALSPLMPRAQFGLRHGRWFLIALESPFQ